MNRAMLALGIAVLLIASGCSKKDATTSGGASPAASQAALPVRLGVDFAFSDVSVSTGAVPILRLGFTVHNFSKDPVQCDPSQFSVQLTDGTTIPVDDSAENKCAPDSIDPGTTGTAVAYFNLKNAYTGPITLIMNAGDATVGKGTTTIK